MAVAPGSILTWLAIREVLKKRNVKGSTILDVGCGDAWMTTKLICSGLASGGRSRAITLCVQQGTQIACSLQCSHSLRECGVKRICLARKVRHWMCISGY